MLFRPTYLEGREMFLQKCHDECDDEDKKKFVYSV
jgi:hypothetical protein